MCRPHRSVPPLGNMTSQTTNQRQTMKQIQTIGFAVSLALLTSCASSPPQSGQSTYRPPTVAARRGTASYTINIEVAFNSEITQGQNRVMVELRQGVPGSSTVFDTKYFEGQMATVSFSQMPAGSYFLAFGNGDSVAVGPVHQFRYGQRQHSTVRVTQSSGNIGTRSRSGL